MRCWMVSKKEDPSFVWGWDSKGLSLAITVCRHSASFLVPIGDLQDGFFYLALTLIIDFYTLPVAKD